MRLGCAPPSAPKLMSTQRQNFARTPKKNERPTPLTG